MGRLEELYGGELYPDERINGHGPEYEEIRENLDKIWEELKKLLYLWVPPRGTADSGRDAAAGIIPVSCSAGWKAGCICIEQYRKTGGN